MATPILPKEQIRAYTRWELESFDAPAPEPPPPLAPEIAPEPELPTPPAAPPPASPALPTAEELEAIYNEAHAKGHEAGYASGYEAGLAEARQQAERLAHILSHLEASLDRIDQEVAEAVLACSLEVARQMTHAALQVRPELLLPTIRAALEALPLHHGPVTLRVNPADAPVLQAHLGEQFGHAGWRIQEDRDIAPGGCRLTAGASEVDATLPTRWRRILETIGVTPEWLDAQP
ncbi:MAG: flagellar assembly protein FliH [Azovibrio sp.]|nr:flagellar assembly protein FliH [Azovibrio sp.]